VVYAFEPTSYAFDKLKRNISLNSTYPIHAFRLALSNRNESNRLINFRSSWQTDGTSISGSSTVDFMRLDNWCEKQDVRQVDMIKIDVDGNEFPVFDGGRKLLSSSRPLIIMEVGAWHFADPSTNVVIMLSDLGYRFLDAKTLIEYSVDQIHRVLATFDTATCESINVVAIPSTGK
jgi:FkbM family methyltransferase